MEAPDAALTYPLADQLPEPGAVLTVAPGVYWIRMGLPFALDHINLWLLEDELDGERGWTVVDCCIDHPAARAQWTTLFTQVLQGRPVLRVVVTHMHPDHIGLAHWLCDHWSRPERACRLWISPTDYYSARVATQRTSGFGGDGAARYFASHGLCDAETLAQIQQRTGYYASLVPEVPRSFRRLEDGLALTIGGRQWQCISGQGHAPDHMALYCAELGVLISGDMVLPRISTNVSVYETEPELDALGLFLKSIDKFLDLPADTLTLPSHGKPFLGLHTRIDQLHRHHDERLAELLALCQTQACCAHDALPVLFKRPLDLHQTTFALGEAIAHLHALWHRGEVQRQQDKQGVWRFQAMTD